MEFYRDDWNNPLTAEKQLKAIIVGAGIAGLVTGIALRQSGHEVVILDQVREVAEVGAGIQMAPNNLRILGRLGLLPEVLEAATLMDRNSMRRWKDNSELASVPTMPAVADRYGAPIGAIHRGDLQRILLEAAHREQCDIRANSKVIKVDENFEARVQLQSGEWLTGDIIIAADGIKSNVRRQIAAFHNHIDHATPTGDSAYRILIPKEKLSHDPAALSLLASNTSVRWVGPESHIVGYPVKNHTVYNMVVLHRDQTQSTTEETKTESWNRKGSKDEMLNIYKDWCPEVQRLLSYVPEGEVIEWTLNSHTPLPSWHENKVVLIGDACHPMLPYVAQGAAQAMEDAAVLQCVLARSSTNIPLAIEIYEQVRKARGEVVQASAAVMRKALHMPDGPEQEERDRAIKAAALGEGVNPDIWADPEFQQFMFGTDVMKETLVKWPEWKVRAEGMHTHALGAVWC